MWVHWAERMNVRVDGMDATIDVDGVRLTLPGGVPLLTRLRDLLRDPRPVEELEQELLAANPRSKVTETLQQMIETRVLVPWELGSQLAQLHQQTVVASEGEVIPPATELGRMFREMGGAHGIVLPFAEDTGVSLREALNSRRSRRAFLPGNLTLEQLGTILSLAASAVGDGPPSPKVSGGPPAHRPYPSGGGLYPVEVLIYPANVAGISPAFYYYQVLAHRLISWAPAYGGSLTKLMADHPVEAAAFFVLFFLDFTRLSLSRYGLKAYRLALIEAGHLAQNILLAVSALHLAALPLCGFDDEGLSHAAGLRYPEQPVVYVLVVGKDAAEADQ
jgi:SagB-type dehydrogenase family enzyme